MKYGQEVTVKMKAFQCNGMEWKVVSGDNGEDN